MKLIAGKAIPTFCWQKPSTSPKMGLLRAVLRRREGGGGEAREERRLICLFMVQFYQYFCPIRSNAQRIAFILGDVFCYAWTQELVLHIIICSIWRRSKRVFWIKWDAPHPHATRHTWTWICCHCHNAEHILFHPSNVHT